MNRKGNNIFDPKNNLEEFNGKGDFEMVATCMQHIEPLLENELRELGAKEIKVLTRAIQFRGDLKLMYKLNICLRTSLKVLVPIYSFKVKNEDQLYKGAKQFAWENLFNSSQTFTLDAAVNSQYFNHSQFAMLRVKDAIVDRFREQGLSRPNVGRENSDLRIHFHLRDDQVNISLDSSGTPLFKRGYKREQHKAPINECLAAAMVLLSGWKDDQTLLDPMCGSGTIAIEAALIASNIAPNLNRERFGFENWSNYDGGLLAEVLEEVRQQSRPIQSKIIARDKDQRSLRQARVNVNFSGMRKFIEVQEGDFFKENPPSNSGMLIFNPPYGERLGEEDQMAEFYSEIGTKLKHSYSGWKACLISSDMNAMKSIGLKTDEKHPLMNGKLECQMRKYSLFEGKRIDLLEERAKNKE